ncbi:tetratricopeptide repeat protein [Yoonia sp. 2307UL14-13]|uniref:tetratricopeptide repeat protein n=1 Tax=Yoonia sp. 2307UL14-13 TaxID=3126506 RepID=UPI0030AD7C69
MIADALKQTNGRPFPPIHSIVLETAVRISIVVAALLISGSAFAQETSDLSCFDADPVTNPPETITACTALIDEKGGDQDLLLFGLHRRGIAKRQAGDMEGSIADFEQYLKIEPDNTATLRMLAWTYREQGRSERAEASYTSILEQDDHWQGWLSRCAVRTDLGRYSLAVSDCMQVEERVNQDPDADQELRESVMQDAWYFWSLSLNQMNKPAEAARVARRGLGTKDINARLYFVTLVGLWNSDQTEEIDSLLSEGLQKYPGDADLEYFLSEWEKR